MSGWTGYVVDEGLVAALRREADARVADRPEDGPLVELLRKAADRIVRLNSERFARVAGTQAGEAG